MTAYIFSLLCALGLFTALQVPGTLSIRTTAAEQNEIVNKHNTLRRNVQPTASSMLKMSWNCEAAANAQQWASSCSMRHSSASDRESSTSGCGENLYLSSYKNTWSNAIQAWGDEVKDFAYGVGFVTDGVVGHYTSSSFRFDWWLATSIVWYRSNQIGCAMAYCPNSVYKYFYVCHYCPPCGTYQLARPYNKGPSCGDCPGVCDNKLCTKL
ncbi:cysteine-rich secretory protein 3-like [Pholidichthys leucotaenia]